MKGYRLALKFLSKAQKHRHCPLCDWKGFQFLPAKPGPLLRFDARCPKCSSSERHRLAYMLLRNDLSDGFGKVLHFAPEIQIRRWLQSIGAEYHSADLYDPNVMHKVDIQNMPFEDDSFDLIWCSHVLEHIADDLKAMKEIRRVLSPKGMAVIQVPLWGNKTVEGDLPASERVRVYYQDDHVRRYGKDIVDRLSSSGLSVTVRNVQELDLQLVLRCSLNDLASNDLFLVRKRL